jgi:hypothetical protein
MSPPRPHAADRARKRAQLWTSILQRARHLHGERDPCEPAGARGGAATSGELPAPSRSPAPAPASTDDT